MDSELLSFLQETDSYPHQPESVQHIQTHISHVFIAPPYVYKFKKSVDFGFLDYSTINKRRKFCHREVELNRRLCEDIYLGVVSIIKRNDHFYFEDENTDDETVVEYAVKMKKLPDEYFLHRYIEEDKLKYQHLDRVADKLTQFYRDQNRKDQLAKWGKVKSIKKNTDENFEQTKDFVGQTIDRQTFNAIEYFTNKYYRCHKNLFQRRIDEGRIVDGHGDLHLDHIHITPQQVRIYDCIEFNDRFRYGDLAADLAFLAMDLDFSGCRQQERYFVKHMAEKLDDSDLLKIIDFYKCYRAYVKGKVKSLQSAEEEVPQQEREKAAETASRYFNLSLRYALVGSVPKVLVFMGRVGTGKSTLSEYLSESLNIERYASDHIRKELANVPLTERPSADQRKELYGRSMSEKTYNELRSKAQQNIEEGRSVILDATFSKRVSRQQLKEAGCLFIEAQAPDETIKKRLEKRNEKEDVISDARLEDFDDLKKVYEPPTEIGEEHLIGINTNQSIDDSINDLFTKLVDRQFQ